MKPRDIISKDEFRYNLLDAALSTRLFGKENGFSCYTDKDYASHFINEARTGESNLISRRELSDIPGKGFHTPEGQYDTIWLHTHTKPMWHPSVGDLNANSDFRFVNNQYKELYDGPDMLSDQKEPYTLECINPIAIIGVPLDALNVDCLVFQEKFDERLQLVLDQYKTFVAGHVKNYLLDKKADKDYIKAFTQAIKEDDEALDVAIANYLAPLDVAVNVMNKSGLYKATDLRIRKGLIEPQELRKLEDFELIKKQTFS